MKTKILLLLLLAFSLNSIAQESMEDKYIVIAGTSTDFVYLESQAKKLNKQTGITYLNWLEYNKEKGMISTDTTDEIYLGQYYPRRAAEERISIEMLWYYQDAQNNEALKDMIIITGIFDDKESAKKQLEKIKKVIPTAYIKKKQMYMGCMH